MKKNYILVGDSIVYGIGDYDNCGWSTLFKKYIIGKDGTKECNNFVHIAAFPGARSYNILDRIDHILNGYKYDDFENIVILSVGVNDTQCFNGKYSVNKDVYKKNMESIIKLIKNKNFELIILGLTKIGQDEKIEFKPNKYYDNEIVMQYDDILKKVCKNNNIAYIPMFDILENEDFIDGLHPNMNGHKKIYKEIVKNL